MVLCGCVRMGLTAGFNILCEMSPCVLLIVGSGCYAGDVDEENCKGLKCILSMQPLEFDSQIELVLQENYYVPYATRTPTAVASRHSVAPRHAYFLDRAELPVRSFGFRHSPSMYGFARVFDMDQNCTRFILGPLYGYRSFGQRVNLNARFHSQ